MRTFGIAVLVLGVSLVFAGCNKEETQKEESKTEAAVSGTWTDLKSKLMWQNPATGKIMDWKTAKQYCRNLDSDGHKDWRLPTIGELRSLVRGCPSTVAGGACGVTDTCLSESKCWGEGTCWSCSGKNGPAEGCYWPDEMKGTCGWYWSSSAVEARGLAAWLVYFASGSVPFTFVSFDGHVRCVRGAQ